MCEALFSTYSNNILCLRPHRLRLTPNERYRTVKFPTLSHSRHCPLIFRASPFKGFHVPQKIKDFVHVS